MYMIAHIESFGKCFPHPPAKKSAPQGAWRAGDTMGYLGRAEASPAWYWLPAAGSRGGKAAELPLDVPLAQLLGVGLVLISNGHEGCLHSIPGVPLDKVNEIQLFTYLSLTAKADAKDLEGLLIDTPGGGPGSIAAASRGGDMLQAATIHRGAFYILYTLSIRYTL